MYLLFKKKNIFFWLSLPILYFLSIIYYFAISILKFLYKVNILYSYKPKAKVISVGNITLGGTGKTPFVEWLADFLGNKNKRIGIIIRGYKRPYQKGGCLVNNDSSYFEIGDEAALFRENLTNAKICVGRDKIESAKKLEKQNCDMLIVDDGFQHWRLKRDLDIVAIDASCPITGQTLLPLGRLREPLSSLKRADIIVLSKINLFPENAVKIKNILNEINSKAIVVSSVYEPLCFVSLDTKNKTELESERFKNKNIFMLSGIANPQYFKKTLFDLGLNIENDFIFPDHYAYKKEDLLKIKNLTQEKNINTIITTQKDAVRLMHLINFIKPIEIFYLEIKLRIIENEKELSRRLLSIFNS